MNARSAEPADVLERAFRCALEAAAPEAALSRALTRLATHDKALVVGAGKAAAAMAATFCAHWSAPVRGFVVTRYAHGLQAHESAPGIEIVEAGHPSPDSASLAAGARLLELAASLGADESMYCLISGGGSALAAAPVGGLTFEHKRDAANFLMHAGAGIGEINCVRKHLSALKGGRLARLARPARVATFAISDVPGDDIADIASGPTIPDRTTQAEALGILERYGYPARDELRPVLTDPGLETPKPGDADFAADRAEIIASAATALDAADAFLQQHGYETLHLGDDLDDEAQSLGRAHARLALERAAAGRRVAILSGGEARVVLSKAGGRGGRNLEYLAALGIELDGAAAIHALAADTDGIDGDGDHAGGIVTPELLERGRAQGLSLTERLAEHDTYSYFDACGLLVRTGPTRTNVNDFRLILCH